MTAIIVIGVQMTSQIPLPFAVVMEKISIFLIAKQSLDNAFPISSVIYSDMVSSLIQYLISAVSFN